MGFTQVQPASKVKLKQLSLQLECILSLGRQLILSKTQHMLAISSRFIYELLILIVNRWESTHLCKFSFQCSNILLSRFQVLTAIGNFCICSIAAGMVVEIIVIYGLQERVYRVGIDNLLVLLIGGIPIAMPTVLSVTMAIGSHRLSQQVWAFTIWIQMTLKRCSIDCVDNFSFGHARNLVYFWIMSICFLCRVL